MVTAIFCTIRSTLYQVEGLPEDRPDCHYFHCMCAISSRYKTPRISVYSVHLYNFLSSVGVAGKDRNSNSF
jgi:hypothetical protein